MIDPEQHYHERLRQFANERVEPGGIVLLGSSHLEWFDAARLLPAWRFVNRGIASDRLGLTERGILHRLDSSVFDCQPAFIVFENGANDLGELWRNGTPPMEAIIAGYERVVTAIRGRLPAVPLLIVNVLPTTGRFAGLNPHVREFNPHVARIAAQHGCTHMDFDSAVASPAGELRAELTEDGLHLNAAGYKLFAARLEPHLPRVTPEPPRR
jgi:lysophospholipase L1-like esterase